MTATQPLVATQSFSHGTIECSDMAKTRRFLGQYLGVDVVRPLPEAQYLWKGGPWSVVCVCVEGDAKIQGQQNHFKLSVRTAAEVDDAHEAAQVHRDDFGIREITPVKEDGPFRAFRLLDQDGSWWEVTTLNQAHYDRLFEQGDHKPA